MSEGNNNGQTSDHTAVRRHVSIGDAATILGVSIDTVRRWEKAGKIYAERLDGKNRYFDVGELERFKINQPLSCTEVAKLLGVSASTVRRLDAEGKLSATRSEKGKRLYDRALVTAYSERKPQEADEPVRQYNVYNSVVEVLEEISSEANSALKGEFRILKQVEKDQAGGLGGGNLHLPFNSWKIGLYLAVLTFGIFALLSGAGFNSRGIFSAFSRTEAPKQGTRSAGAINLQSFITGQEAGDIAVLPIAGSQIEDGSIGSTDIAEGVITFSHLSNDLQQLLDESSEITLGEIVGPRGPRGLQGETGPQGPAGPAGGGSSISDVVAGLGLSGGGSAGSISLGVNTANGTTIVGDAVEVRLATSATSSTTGSVSGMELTAQGLRLLGGCSAGNILKWNGSQWACNTDDVGSTGTLAVADGGTGATSFTVNGVLFGNGTSAIQATAAGSAGQIILANASGVPTFTTLSGDITVSSTGVTTLKNIVGLTSGTYGNATQVPQIVVDTTGRITSVTNTTISGVTPGGSAGGDLSGTYPNPSVVKINGSNLGTTTPTAGNLLLANGTQWSTTALSGDLILNGSGVAAIQSNSVALGGDTTGDYMINLGTLTGLTTTGNAGEGSTPTLAVNYGSTLNTAVQGNTQITVTAGTGLSGGGTYTLGSGGSQTLNLANTSVSANSYGSASSVATFTVDAQGRLTVAGSTAIDINANQVTAGALSTTRGGTGVDASAAANGQLLIGNGTGFGLANLAAGNGIGISNGAGSISVSTSLQANKGLEVDGNGLSLIDCASSEILKYSVSNQWVCATDAAGGVTDADKGDITVTGSGNSWSIDNGAVSNAKLQNSTISLLYSGNVSGDASVALGSTLNIGFSATPSFTSVSAATFTGSLTGNASTASALAANPSDCAADTYATTIAANGNLSCASITDAALSSNVTKLGAAIDLATSEVSGQLRAIGLQVAAADLGAADVNINFSNSNGSFNTNLTIDGVVTAASFIGALSGNATTATALASDPNDCAANTYTIAIAANGNLTCASITDASLSSNVTKLGTSIQNSEVDDDLTVSASGSIADGALSANVSLLGSSIQDAEIDDNLTISASGSIADGALSANVTKLGNTIDLATAEVSGNLRATSLQSVAADLGAADVTLNLSNTNGSFNTNLILDGSVTASSFTGSLVGNAGTATALASDPTDCAANTFAHSINNTGNLTCSVVNKTSLSNTGTLGFTWSDAEVSDTLTLGASSSVADAALSVNVTKLGSTIDLATAEVSGNLRATNLQVAAADLGAADVDINLGNTNGSFNTNLILDGTVTAATFSGALSGNATTATALAANPADCVANQFAIAINASGTLSCAALTDSDVPDTLTIGASSTVGDGALSSNVTKLGSSIQNAEVDDDLTISASGSVADGALSTNVTKLGSAIDLATGEISGNLRANNLQNAAADLGAADVTVNLSNSNGAFNTNLILDGSMTAGSFVGPLTGNASTATALAGNPTDCGADTFATTIATNGNLTCSTVSKTALANSGTLGFTWSDAEVSNTLTASIFSGSGSTTDAVDLATAEISGVLADANVADTLTIGASSTVADGALSANVTKLGSSIQNSEVDDDLTVSASGSVADGALSANVTKLGSAVDLATSEVSGQLRATNFQNSAADLGAADVDINLGNTNGSFNTNLTIDGVITATSFSGSLSGNATTATALAANPGDCATDTYATTIAASGNLTCASITDAALSSNVTKLGATITKDELTGTGTLGFTWSDSEVADTLTVGASSTVADAALSGNVTKLGSSIQNAEVDDDLTISASGSVADGALSSNITKLGSAIDLATSEVSGNLRATNLQSAAADLGAANVDIVLSNTNGSFVTNLTLDGSVTATTFNGALSGNATTATALASDPSDCAADTYATAIATSGNLTCVAVTKTGLANSGSLAFTWSDGEVSNTLTASILVGSGSITDAVDLATPEVAGNLRATNFQNSAADLGGADVNINLGNTNGSFNTNLTTDGTITANSFSGGLSGNASTATALAGNPTDCGSDTYATAIAASGNLSCAAITDAALSSNVTKLGSAIDLATSEVSGQLRATNLQNAAADLGAANVDIVLSNTNGSFVTNLTVDGTVTATTFSGALSGNATTATALAANPSDCAADTYAISVVANGNLTCATVTKTGIANSGTLAFTWSDAEVSDTLTASIVVGSGSSSNAVDLATAEVAGNMRANNLQSAAADLGAGDVTVNLSNSNSTFNTNLTLDGDINTTAGALQLNGVDINTAGTLTNVAYENQANTFTVASSFTAAGTALSVTNNASIGGSLSVGSVTIGTSGTPILKHLSGTATNLVSASIGATACANYGTITVTGAVVGDTVYASPAAQAGGIETVNLDYMAIVTAANTVTIRACNPTLGSINTGDTQEWRADVWQH